jgi:hypothetical protein
MEISLARTLKKFTLVDMYIIVHYWHYLHILTSKFLMNTRLILLITNFLDLATISGP